MVSYKSFLVWELWICFLLKNINICVSHSEDNLVLLISFDGFRWDYLEMVNRKGFKTPHLDSLQKSGAKANWIKNTFITKTFPNHYSIVTGFYEESHGVVANEFYDPVFKDTFKISNASKKADPKWWNNGIRDGGAEPVWITNQIAEKRSGVHGWPGPEGLYHEQKPYKHVLYDHSITFLDRVDTVINWFTDESKKINLGVLYFEEPDSTGHRYGPDAKEMVTKILELDNVTGYLIDQLKLVKLFERMNIIFTSDHGMAKINKSVYIDEYLDPSYYVKFGGSPVWNILPKKGFEDIVYKNLTNVPHVHVYKKNDIPKEYFYTNNRRIQPIIMAAQEGVMLYHNRNESILWPTAGNHGYNNSVSSMHPFFIAHGPAFKQGAVVDHFNNIDIYPLLCHLLDIDPVPNNGSLDRVKGLLVSGENSLITIVTFFLAVVMAATISGIFCIAACRSHRFHLRPRRVMEVPLNNSYPDGQTPLLTSDEEEIA